VLSREHGTSSGVPTNTIDNELDMKIK
jgi:hypothetical protein